MNAIIESEPSTNSADFDPMFPDLGNFSGDGVFFKCCLVTSSGPALLNIIF